MSLFKNFFKRLNSSDEDTTPQKRVKVSESENSLKENKCSHLQWNEINSKTNHIIENSFHPPPSSSKLITPTVSKSFASTRTSKTSFFNQRTFPVSDSAEELSSRSSYQPNFQTRLEEPRGANHSHDSRQNTDETEPDDQRLPSYLGARVMVMGEGSCGQIGLGQNLVIAPELTMVKGVDEDVVDVCAGGMHTLCLTKSGKVYSFGCNDHGALGRKTIDDSEWFAPQPIKAFAADHVIRISAGDGHSAAVTEDGRLFVWGTFRKENGDCRLTSSTNVSALPIHLGTSAKVTEVQSGSNHLLVLTDDCEVLSIGSGERGQLGRIPETFENPSDSLLFELKAVTIVKKEASQSSDDVHIVDIWAGNYSSFARDVDGNIYAWGLNNYHQLGFTDTTSRYVPCQWMMSPPMDVKQVSPGDHHTLLLSEEGEVFSIGKGHYGQLGHGKVGHWEVANPESAHGIYQSEVTTFTKVDNLTHVCHVMAGLSVSFAVSQDGRLYRWGQKSYQLGGKGDDDDDDDDNGADDADDDDEASKDIFIPELIECDSRVIKASSNGLHTAVMAL